MSIGILVNGAKGKMGVLACNTIEQSLNFQLLAGLTRADNLEQAIKKYKPQIILELTRADCVYQNSLTIIEQGVHPVIGATGLTPEQITHLQRICEQGQLGGIIAPNFSLGAILMMRFAAQAANYLSQVEIIEAHHPQKFDAPSGTAQKTAELIASQRKESPPFLEKNELFPGVRGGVYKEIPIHSVRLPGFLAHQQVIFGNQGETLTITHNSIDRSCFSSGILLCCQKVMTLKTLCYGMEQLLDSSQEPH